MRKAFILPLFFIFSCTILQVKKEKLWMEDVIYTNKGEEIECGIIEIDDEYVYAVTEDGDIVLRIEDLRSVDIAKRRRGYQWETIDDITDPILKEALNVDLSEYGDMGYVNIRVEKKFTINNDSSYIYSIRYIRAITEEKGRTAGTLAFNYRNKEENIEVDFARTITSEGRVLHLREIAIEDASVYSRIPPYENLHERKFAMREVKPGNILDFGVSINGKITDESPYVMDITLGDAGPTLSGIVEVVAPKDFELSWQEWNIEKPVITRGSNRKFIQWKVEDLPPLVQESNRPPITYILPRVVVGLENTWEKVIENFRLNLRGDYTAEGMTSEEIYKEIIRAVHFIDIPSYTSSPYPKSVKEITNNRVANSLDKAHLLYIAYRSAGLPIDFILVRSKERGELADEVPSLYQFDGALIKVGDDFLDPASELNPYGYVRVKYQGTKGLSLREKGFIDIPLFNADKEKVSIKREINLDENGDAHVDEHHSYFGNQVLLIRQLRYMREEEKRNAIESFINRSIPNAELKNYTIEHLGDITPEITFDLEYNAQALGLKEGDFILLHLPGIQYSAYSVGALERNYPIYWGVLSTSENEITIQIPEGYKIRYIPGGVEAGSNSLEFKSEVLKSGNKIIYRDSYIDKDEMVPVEEYTDYKKAIMQIATLPEEWIILEKE